MSTGESAVFGGLIGFCLGVVFCILVDSKTPIKVRADQPITPDLTIEVRDGQADTTFVYTEPE